MITPTAPTRRPALRGRTLEIAALVFAVALAVHGADHLRRGTDAVTGAVLASGLLQQAAAVVTLVVVFRHHRAAAQWATVMGLASAVGFTAVHLLPHWSVFSDSFTGAEVAPGVTAFSWFAALFEIGAGLLLGVAGLRHVEARVTPVSAEGA